MKSFNINISDFEFGNRLVPSFYYYTQVLKKQSEKKGIRYEKLEDLCTRISDGEHSHIQRRKSNGIRYLYGRNLKEGIINFDPISDDPYILESDFIKFTRSHIKQNDVLISIYGTIGKSAIYKEEYVGKAGIPRHISSISLKKYSPLTGEYLTAYFRSKVGKGQLFSTTTGNIQQLLSLKNIRKLDIPIAEDKVIKEITQIEDQAIRCESKALSLIQKAKELFYEKTGLLKHSFDKNKCFSVNRFSIVKSDLWTPKYFYPYYHEILDFISDSNDILSLRDLIEVVNGDEVGSSNYIDYHNKNDKDIAFIRTSDIINFEIDQYPDYFVDSNIYKELAQDIKPKDILFTKDGKIGLAALIGKNDKAIISSGISRLRVSENAIEKGITPEYLFLNLAIKEIGLNSSTRRSVVASTIPHLREERLKDIEIPILESGVIGDLTNLISEAFKLKDDRKLLARKATNIIDNYFLNE